MADQTYLSMYRDPACTIKYSEHWSSQPDSFPVTPLHPMIVPYAGILMSDIFPVYLKVKPGFKTVGITTVTIDCEAYNQGGHGVNDRWMLGLDPLLRSSWWGEPLYIEQEIKDDPLTIYVRARTKGPVKTAFSKNYDVNINDWNVHFMVYARIFRRDSPSFPA